MSAKRLVDNGKWALWVLAFLVAGITANRMGIGELKVQAGKVETHIEYIRAGIQRLEIERGTFPKAKR